MSQQIQPSRPSQIEQEIIFYPLAYQPINSSDRRENLTWRLWLLGIAWATPFITLLLMLLFRGGAGLPSLPFAFEKHSTQKVVSVFQQSNLEVVNVTPIPANGTLLGIPDLDSINFDLATLRGSISVSAFKNQGDLDKGRSLLTQLGTYRIVVKDNILLAIPFSIPDDRARPYQETLNRL